ncbi:hypothetical protein ES703_108820 [subsurface metagenome]
MLKEIAIFIKDLGLGPPPHNWRLHIDLFAGHVPVKNKLGNDTPERYLAVLENAGGSVLTNVGGVWCRNVEGVVCPSSPSVTWPKYIEKAVQLLNRAKTYFTARDDAEVLFDALHNTAGWELPNKSGDPAAPSEYIACVVDAYGAPAPIENPGERGLFLFSTNYIWKIEKAS